MSCTGGSSAPTVLKRLPKMQALAARPPDVFIQKFVHADIGPAFATAASEGHPRKAQGHGIGSSFSGRES